MRTRALVMAAVATISVGGCHHMVPRDTLVVHELDLNLAAQRGPTTVLLADGAEVEAPYFNIAGDSALWTDESGTRALGAPVASIDEIHVRDRLSGMLVGTYVAMGFTLLAGRGGELSMPLSLAVIIPTGFLGWLIGVPVTYEIVDPPPP